MKYLVDEDKRHIVFYTDKTEFLKFEQIEIYQDIVQNVISRYDKTNSWKIMKNWTMSVANERTEKIKKLKTLIAEAKLTPEEEQKIKSLNLKE